jgi:serine protease AprX
MPAVLVAAAPAVAAPAREHAVRAVVMTRPGAALPVAVAGMKVTAVLRSVGAEVVTATPSQLRALATDSRVIGISPDRHGRVSGDSDAGAFAGNGVLASKLLGGQAGRPGTGRGVNVALLDTGVSDTAALSRASGRINDGVDVSGLAAGRPAQTGGDFTDGYGHGTFMASLIAGGQVPGSHGRALGVAPDARIIVVKVADSEGQTSLSEVLAGLDWVAAHAQGINIVNLSIAVDPPDRTDRDPGYGPDPLNAAIEHVRAAGVVVVAAAGNVAGVVGDPGLDPQALTVGAADVSNPQPQVASFSGSGVVAGVSKPDVVAPGVHVLGMINADSRIAQDHPEGQAPHGLFKGSGTSEATAITSGIAAAYLSQHPGAGPLQVKAAIRGAAATMRDSRAGAGLVRMVNGQGVRASADNAGEAGLDPAAWAAGTWTGLPGWQEHLASMWSGPAWDAVSWSDAVFDAVSWSDSNWSAVSWSAVSWSAVTWSAVSWSAVSWSAVSWSAVSWSAVSWSDYGWGDAA